MECRGDWIEFCSEFGFRGVTAHHPIPFNLASKANLFEFEDANRSESPWPPISQTMYETIIASHEVHVRVNNVKEHRDLAGALFFDKRETGGSNGLAIYRPITAAAPDGTKVRLVIGDRLESTFSLQDPHQYFGLQTFPADVTFWRFKEPSDTFYPRQVSAYTHKVLFPRRPLWDLFELLTLCRSNYVVPFANQF